MKTSFDAVVGGANKVVAAALTGWNGSAPLTGDETLEKVNVEMLVIQRGKRRIEKELIDISFIFKLIKVFVKKQIIFYLF